MAAREQVKNNKLIFSFCLNVSSKFKFFAFKI